MEKQAVTPDVVKFVEDSVFSAKTIVNMAIYAILEAPQELYFGSHSEKDINVLEKVVIRLDIKDGNTTRAVDVEKPYYSPTKQRGVERRAIAYSLVKVGDKLVPYYRYFNLSIDVADTYPDGRPDPRDILTYLWGATWTKPTLYMRGRIGYGGGVAVQPGPVLTKQRNRVEYRHFEAVMKERRREKEKVESEGEEEAIETAQILWSKEYAEPHLLIPVYRTGILLGVENYEPHALAYAFLKGLELAGAGTPKGLGILEAYWISDDATKKEENTKQKVLVVDIGVNLMPEPVVVSPAILSPIEALAEFKRKAEEPEKIILQNFENVESVFEKVTNKNTCVRLVGNTAYKFLEGLADKFAREYLLNIESLSTPRVQAGKQAQQQQSK